MNGPISNPPPLPDPSGPIVGGSAGGDAVPPDVVALEAELAAGDGSRLARYARRARTLARVLAGLVAGTGVLALVVGLAAWRDHPAGLLLVVLCCLPAIVAPLYVARRTGALAHAAGHPREAARQAQDLVGRVRHSAELQTLAGELSRRGSRGAGAAPAGRVRGTIRLARLASTVIGQAQPDDERHPLLLPFTPERLARTWSAVGMSLWGWAIAALVLVVSVPALVVSLV